MTAINPPALQPQDKSRIITIPINKPRSGILPEDIKSFLSEAREMSPRLRARAIIGFKRFNETFSIYRKLLVEHGCDARQSDLYATLCAGRSLLIEDSIPSHDTALDFVSSLGNRLSLIMLDDSDDTDAKRCLNRLLDASCEAIRDGIKRSIGQLVADAMNPMNSPENDKLVPLGIRMIDVKGSKPKERMLFVANDHLGLKKIFFNTPWADGNWKPSLSRLPGVKPSPVPISVGRKSRGLLIPAVNLPSFDNEHEVDVSQEDPAPLVCQT
jgi:hypothetical protein